MNFFCMPVYALQMLGTQRVPLEVKKPTWILPERPQDMPMITVGGSKCLFGGQARRFLVGFDVLLAESSGAELWASGCRGS